MEINVPWEEMRKRRLFISTPMYGGMNHGQYSRSVQELITLCHKNGIFIKMHYLFNESLITRARTYAVAEFLERSDCTHFMFIDADIHFDPMQVLTLMAIQGDETPFDVIGAVYPKKAISWEKVYQAVNSGVADDDPNVLEYFVGDMVFNPIINEDGTVPDLKLDQPYEVAELGTGFMMIRRTAFEKFALAYPELLYKPDHVRSEHFDGSKEITLFFDAAIDPESRRYLSEDYLFCKKLRAIGGRIWICPWMDLGHIGTYEFKGSLHRLSSVGAAATVDQNKVKKRSDII